MIALPLRRHAYRPVFTIRRTTYVAVLCMSVLAGLVAGRFVDMPLWAAVAWGIAAFSLKKRPLFHLVCIVACGVSLGVWRGGEYMHRLAPYQALARQKVVMQAAAATDAVYGDNGQLSFEVKHIRILEPYAVTLPGTVRVSGFGELAVYRGDSLRISGNLYPTRGGKQAAIGYAQFRRVGSRQTVVESALRTFTAGVHTALPEPYASFGMGLLVGQRNTLPDETTQAFKMVGLSHIIAVSGYNLTILIHAARRTLGARSKRMATIAALGLMGVFLLFTGLSASIVRASMVSLLGIAAWYYGRTVRPVVLITLAAAITAAVNPIYLWSDIGWYLSFLAFFGILVIAPAVAALLSPGRSLPALAVIALETVSAELMTIPLIMYIFGQVSLVGLAANVAVVSVIPFAMAGTFICGVAGSVAPLLVGWIAWPTVWLLTYMVDIAELLSRVPHAYRTNVYLSAASMMLCYGTILAALAAVRRVRGARVQSMDAIS